MKKSFSEVFTLHTDQSIEPLHPVSFGGIQFGPGVRFGKGVSLGGFDLTQFVGRDFEVETEVNGSTSVWKLKGVY